MDRRKYLKTIVGGSPLLLLPNNHLLGNNMPSSEWLSPFRVRWQNTELYCHEIFEGMPDSDFSFQPTPEMMSFGKLFSHIGNGLNVYAGVLNGTTAEEEPQSENKTDVLEYLDNGFNNFISALENINAEDLHTKNHGYPEQEPWKEFTISDIIILAYNHTVHHSAQATVYLRLKGIRPSQFRF